MGGGIRAIFMLIMCIVIMYDLIVLGIYLTKQNGKK
jgi:hypothetical protein